MTMSYMILRIMEGKSAQRLPSRLACAPKHGILDIACRATAPSGMPISLIPLYRILYGLVLKSGRQTISPAATKLIVAAGAIVSIKAIWELVSPSVKQYFTCSMSFPTDHQVARRIQAWIAVHIEGLARRHTSFPSGQVKFNKVTREVEMHGDMMTAMSKGWFWFEGRPIIFEFLQQPPNTQEISIAEDSDHSSGMEWRVKKQLIRISTPGWSGAVLERFTQHVSASRAIDPNMTMIFEMHIERRYGELKVNWRHRMKAPRPLSTIDLDEKIKTDLVGDIKRFMDKSQIKWYGDRGIPYRRGYMFFGPPGTGKTSVCHALAGVYNTSLYIMSLSEVPTESHLRKLFRTPQKGDILLLEDIDSSGIVRENMRGKETEAKTSKEQDSHHEKENEREGTVLESRIITLSVLLSAIDGLADGVILIMTSNKPETLDKALIRNGRIDKQVLFGNVSQAVAKSIFVRMYQEESDNVVSNNGGAAAVTRLSELGDAFSTHIPNLRLTPAEIQGFLIERSAKPETAIAEVDQWVTDMLKAKEAAKNFVGDDGEGSATDA